MGLRLKHLQLSVLVVSLLFEGEHATSQDRRSVRVGNISTSQVKVVRPNGVSNVAPGADKVEVKRGELLFERLDQQAVITPAVGGARHELPYKLYGVSSDGSDLNLSVVVDVEGGGMRVSPTASSFVGRLRFGVIDKQKPNSQQVLPSPVLFLITANVDSVSPDAVVLDHTNLPFAPLTLSAGSPGDTISVQIRPSFSANNPVKVDVGVIRPELAIKAFPRRIQGWGLEEADITIEAKGIEQPEQMKVVLDTTKGGLDGGIVSLDKAGVGSARIRSIGLGSAAITASSSRLKSTETELTFTLPWAFGISAILGAVMGVFAKKFAPKPAGRKLTTASLFAGMALGILGATAYAVGVNLTGYVPHAKVGEALPFFVAGIVAYAGSITRKDG